MRTLQCRRHTFNRKEKHIERIGKGICSAGSQSDHSLFILVSCRCLQKIIKGGGRLVSKLSKVYLKYRPGNQEQS